MIRKIIDKLISRVSSINRILDILFLFLAIYMIIKGYFKVEMLIMVILILTIIILYKYISHEIGVYKCFKTVTGQPFNFDESVKETRENCWRSVLWFIRKLRSRIGEKKWCMEMIFWIFRIIPVWNWVGSLIIGVWVKWYDIKVIVLSNIDVYNKKKGRKKGEYKEWKYMWVIRWVIIYPIYRMILYPSYLREKIYNFISIKDIIKVRFIGYIYSTLYLSIGYYEIISGLEWYKYIIVIYIYFGIIFPGIIWIRIKLNKHDNLYNSYRKPLLIDKLLKRESLTRQLFKNYLKAVRLIRGSYIQIKYNFSGESLINMVWESKRRMGIEREILWFSTGRSIEELRFDIREKLMIIGGIEELKEYEKNYGVSMLISYKMLREDIVLSINLYREGLYMYKQGLDKLGVEFMRRYDYLLEQMKEYYKCNLFLLMDIKRWMGEEWIITIGKEDDLLWDIEKFLYLGYKSFKEQLERDKEELRKKKESKIPEKYCWNLKIYNKILYNLSIMNEYRETTHFFELQYPDISDDIDYLIIHLAKVEGLTNEDKSKVLDPRTREECYTEEGIKDLFRVKENIGVWYKKYKKKYVDAIDIIKKESYYPICEEWNKRAIEEYKEKYKQLEKDEFKLISEEYIKAYRLKYNKYPIIILRREKGMVILPQKKK